MQLFFAPATSARVALTALEEVGAKFVLKPIAFFTGDHHRPEFLAVDPKGKDPALAIDGYCLTENAAIFDCLANRFPEAALLPPAHTARPAMQRAMAREAAVQAGVEARNLPFTPPDPRKFK